jgi:tryptophanyl-tRNA synthetase
MAADILVQKATRIPVGEDQVAHIETTRDLAHRFNKRYGDIFPIPQVQQYQSLRILSLKGDGKMSKSSPEGAIFLTDTMEDVEKKIKRAQTAFAGEMSPSLESLILIAKGLATNDDDVLKVDDFINKHLAKENVMGGFKELVVSIVQKFLSEFQKKRSEVLQNPQYLADILAAGGKVALANANKTLFDVEAAMMRGESSELTN